MKTLKILHLYYDLLNLYGENGNIRYLEYKLKEQNISYQIDKLSLNQPIHFRDYDIVYVGTGTEDNLHTAHKDIMKYRQDIYESMKTATYIVTGNALCLFGESIEYLSGLEKALNIIDFSTKEVEERIVGEQRYKTELINENVIGFQNRNFIIDKYQETPLFNVINGNSYNNDNKENTKEGIYRKNLYMTFTIGPLLVRNPYLTDYIIKEICKNNNIEYKQPDYNDVSYKAYTEYLKNFYTN